MVADTVKGTVVTFEEEFDRMHQASGLTTKKGFAKQLPWVI